MKRVTRSSEPTTLVTYRSAHPGGEWDHMRDDPFNDGQQAYLDVKRALVRAQRCICAYCEIDLAADTTDAEIERRRPEQRVEHFHSKGDRVGPTNWGLQWDNLFAVCLGGSPPPPGAPADPARHPLPLPENLSCDSFKAHQTAAGRLPLDPTGWILAPDQIPAFPVLFAYAGDGSVTPHPTHCAAVVVADNNYPTFEALVANTIVHLNLNCTRLTRVRMILGNRLEQLIFDARTEHPTASRQDVLLGLARKLLTPRDQKPWRAFFTLVRARLGEGAEHHLRLIGFDG